MRATIISVMLLFGATMPSHAEPGPIENWLMNEPLTLWDKGMMAMQEDAREAAKAVAADKGTTHWISVAYHWENKRRNINGNEPEPPLENSPRRPIHSDDGQIIRTGAEMAVIRR